MRYLLILTALASTVIFFIGCSEPPQWTTSDISVIKTGGVEGTGGYSTEATSGYSYVVVRGIFSRDESVAGELLAEDIELLTEHRDEGNAVKSEWPLEGIMASTNNIPCTNYFLLSSYITANSTVSNMDGEEFLSLKKENEEDAFHLDFKENPVYLCLLFLVEDKDFTAYRLRVDETIMELPMPAE